MAVYKPLTKSINLENLSEGDVINRRKYIEKLEFFEKFDSGKGTYITDKSYRGYGEEGLHYYKYTTLIEYFSNFFADEIIIEFSENGKLSCK